MYIERAISAAEYDGATSGSLELLARPGQTPDEFFAEYCEACLIDLQVLMDLAWESGEVGEAGQLNLFMVAA